LTTLSRKFIVIFGIIFFSVNSFALGEIIIIRHGEKLGSKYNLNQQGFERSLQLPKVLNAYKPISEIYAPALKAKSDCIVHARPLQTIIPFAIDNNLNINMQYKNYQAEALAKHLLSINTTQNILVVWTHTYIPLLAKSLGIKNAPNKWNDDDFDSIWIISYPHGKGSSPILTIKHQNILFKSNNVLKSNSSSAIK
jgi:hypothetical protein